MVSRAGYDAAFVAKIAPGITIFVPGREGRSHFRGEFRTNAGIGLGVAVQTEAVNEFDRKKEN